MTVARRLIDVSSWQHPAGAAIDWAKVAASGVAGVIIKVTQGTGYASPWFVEDYLEAVEAGLLVGAYHFAEPDTGTAEEQASWCNDHTMGLDLPLGLWLDLEVMEAGGAFPTSQWATVWLTAMKTATRKVGVYLDQSFTDMMPALADAWPLWQVTLEGQVRSHNPVIVQTGIAATVDGIVGPCDSDDLVSDRWVNPPGPKPVVPPIVEEEPMFIVIKSSAGPEAATFDGCAAYPIISGATLAAYSAAGVKEAVVAPEDFAAAIKRGATVEPAA